MEPDLPGSRCLKSGEQNNMASPPRLRKSAQSLTRRLKLHYVQRNQLTIERRRAGEGYTYRSANGTQITDPASLQRFASLAVPPAYEQVYFSPDPRAHLQAVGRDAAGRLQYRYHPDWEKVRETQKAGRLAALASVLPTVRRAVAQHLSGGEPTRNFALAAAIELVAGSAIRPGSEEYAKKHGTRGAVTLLKSNVRVSGDMIALVFRAKGGKDVRKEFSSPRLAAAIAVLRTLPGPRLFQYRDETGVIKRATAREVNQFLREMANIQVSLKDFRTLCASAAVLDNLARMVPAESARKRRKQVLEAVKAAADELSNTPTVCRRSYVHETVVTAFEKGVLERFSSTLKACRSSARREQFLAQVVATASV
jgi:DNA topoisomerase-1